MIDINRYKKIFGEDFEISGKKKFWQLRANTIKMNPSDLENRLKGSGNVEVVKFYQDAFIVETQENLVKSLEHVLGYFFLQNLSSMIPPLVLDAGEDDRVLDMSAAPGAKTTEIAALMGNKGVIVANDVAEDRLKALRGNLQRCGVANSVVTRMDGRDLVKSGVTFSKILLDTPCTGTGSLSPKILKMTSEGSIRKLSNLQKQLLYSAAGCLEKGGILVYSTCSLEPEENEENIDYAVSKLGLVAEKIYLKDLDFIKGLTGWENKNFDDSVSNAIRVLPNGIFEGFFICKLRKN